MFGVGTWGLVFFVLLWASGLGFFLVCARGGIQCCLVWAWGLGFVLAWLLVGRFGSRFFRSMGFRVFTDVSLGSVSRLRFLDCSVEFLPGFTGIAENVRMKILVTLSHSGLH